MAEVVTLVDAGKVRKAEIKLNGLVISRSAFVQKTVAELRVSPAEANNMFEGLYAKIYGRWGSA